MEVCGILWIFKQFEGILRKFKKFKEFWGIQRLRNFQEFRGRKFCAKDESFGFKDDSLVLRTKVLC